MPADRGRDALDTLGVIAGSGRDAEWAELVGESPACARELHALTIAVQRDVLHRRHTPAFAQGQKGTKAFCLSEGRF